MGTCIAAVAGLRECEAAKRFSFREGHEVLRLLLSRAKLFQRVAVQRLSRSKRGQGARASKQAHHREGSRKTSL